MQINSHPENETCDLKVVIPIQEEEKEKTFQCDIEGCSAFYSKESELKFHIK